MKAVGQGLAVSRGLRRCEKDETPALRDLADEMDSACMLKWANGTSGGRKALVRECMQMIEKDY